ncbi:hypothetical protein AO385_1536 [Moraxella catarrhalis]|nr:hypothetical protein AO383_1805 [Moraxella catarrhalis]OAU98910.1 hypothetical protein AO385_1536 [Moraxella catarrhalis]
MAEWVILGSTKVTDHPNRYIQNTQIYTINPIALPNVHHF